MKERMPEGMPGLCASVESFEFSGFCQSHTLFIKYFSSIQCDFLLILAFLTESGARDGVGTLVGMIYDFGVGNQSFDICGQKHRYLL
jgi:hypothetical protein